ncbi:MAG: alpha/beta hydrolase [Gemmataceae bacterium]
MLCLVLLALAQHPEVPLYPGAAASPDRPTLTAYLPAKDKATGTAVIVCPGGGYGGVMMTYEGREVAQWLADRGIAGYVLRYRHAPTYRHPVPLQDAQRAIRTVRLHAKDNGIDPARIGIWGFSAGGHLASCAATLSDPGDPKAKDPAERLSSRPDFAILAYPVITLQGPFAHGGSRANLLGAKADPKLVDALSTHTRVTKETPPVFLFHTKADKAVPAGNSELFRDACLKAGVPVKLRLAEQGSHGVGLGLKGRGDYAGWADDILPWLKERGLLRAPKD